MPTVGKTPTIDPEVLADLAMADVMSRLGITLGSMLLIGGCGMSGTDPNVVSVATSDARMSAATAEARSTVGTFIQAIKNPSPGMSDFMVKVPVPLGSGMEHVWVKSVRYDGEQFHGVVNNQPAHSTGIKLGDPLTARPDGISDWMYLQGRRLVGGYTIRAVRDGLSAGEREAFDRSSPFVIETADGKAARAPREVLGTWDLMSIDSGGGAAPRPGVRMEITERAIEMVNASGARKRMGEIAAVDLTTTPKRIDLTRRPTVGYGIYEIKGDEMKLIVCDPGRPRPTEFKGEQQGMLFVLKRQR